MTPERRLKVPQPDARIKPPWKIFKEAEDARRKAFSSTMPGVDGRPVKLVVPPGR